VNASARGWSRWNGLALLGLALLAILAFRSSWADIAELAVSRPTSHYLLFVPAVVAYLFWIRRSRLPAVRCRPSLLGPLVIVAAFALHGLGDERDIHAARHLAAVLGLVGAVLSFTGAEAIRQFGPAFVAMLFLVPLPGSVRQAMAVPLQSGATAVTQTLLESLGISAIREGSILVIRGTPIAVGEACDGMRMVLPLVLVVYAFVFSMPLRSGMRIFLVALAPGIALLVNVLRLVPSGVAYGFSDPEVALRIHEIAGWFMLVLAVLIMYGVLRVALWIDLPVHRWRLLQS